MKTSSTLRAALCLPLTALAIALTTPAFAQPCHLVISQVYGAGGNAGATWRNDFIEVFNPTGASQSLAGWSVQYASSAGTTWTVTTLSGSIAPGAYYLVQQASGGANGTLLPTADATGTISMAAGAGKVALCSSTTALSGSCPTGGAIVDFVGYGAAANCFEGAGPTTTLTATTAAIRAGAGCTDTDSNSANFAAATPTPRNSATAANYCIPTQLVITTINPASPTAGVGFDVTVEARNANNVAQNVTAATLVTLTTNGNAGAIGGTTSNTIANGTSSIVISGVTLASAGTLVTLTATATPGQTCLTAGTSSTFTVVAAAGNTTVQFTTASSSVGEAVGTTNIPLSITDFSTIQATNATITATGATGRITSFTSPVIFPANDGSNQNNAVLVIDNSLCDGPGVITFTITGVTGGQGTPTVGAQATHQLTITDNDVCTSVQFNTTSSSVSETGTSINLGLGITNFDVTNATSVTIAASGATGRITSFTTPVIFPANDGSTQSCTVALDNNLLCDGAEDVVFTITGISGGQGTPFIGANNVFTLTVLDNETPVDPVATAGNPITTSGFDANWNNNVTGATGYFLDVSLYADFLDPNTTTVVEWNFPNVTDDAIADGGIGANAAQVITAVGTAAATFATSGATTRSARATGWDNGNGTKYWQVEMVTTGYFDLEVNSAQRSSGTGPQDFKLQYRIGTGGAWTDVSGGAVTVADDFTTGVLNGLSLPAICEDQAQVFLRWIMTSNEDVNVLVQNVAAGGASRIDDIVITGRPTLNVVGYDNLSVGNVLTSPVVGLLPATTYYYRVRSVGGCSTGDNSNTISVTTNPIPNYYSRATGNVTDPIWSDTPNGTAGPAVWSGGSNMIVQSPDVVTNTANVPVGTCTVDLGGTLILNGGTTLSIHGGSLFAQGTFTANDNSTVEMLTFAGTGVIPNTVSFYDLTINLPGTVAAMANIDIRGTLQLTDGTYDAVGGTTTLRSTATGTGRLGPVAATASYVGNMKIERYIPAGTTNWRLLGSPIQGRKVNHWMDDFVTAGFPGSDVPWFDSPVGSGILWPSIRWYDETNPGGAQNDGRLGVTSNTQNLNVGQGFAAWCGDNLFTTNAFVIDLENQAPVIASTPLTLPMTYTNTGNATVDGWNLVSNPVPSPIAFDQISRGADVEDYVTYYNPANGNTAVWDISLNLGTNGATNTIQSSQGFFLKAVGPAVTTTVDENDKVNDNGGGMFGLPSEPPPHLRLRISSALNGFSDEVVLAFSEGEAGLDPTDAVKYIFATEAAPQMACLIDGEALAISAHGSVDAGATVAMGIEVGLTGQYTIEAVLEGGLELACLSIADVITGEVVDLTQGGTISFSADETELYSVPRFMLRINEVPAASIVADNNLVGVGEPVQFTGGPVATSYAWDFGDGSTSQEQSPTHAWTIPGTYTVTLAVSDGACTGSTATDIEVELGTGISEATAIEPAAWLHGEHIVVQHAFTGNAAVHIDLLDATGRLAMQRTAGAATTRVLLPAQDLATGVWFVRMTQGQETITLRVPLVR